MRGMIGNYFYFQCLSDMGNALSIIIIEQILKIEYVGVHEGVAFHYTEIYYLIALGISALSLFMLPSGSSMFVENTTGFLPFSNGPELVRQEWKSVAVYHSVAILLIFCWAWKP
jgi:hypothetical protein